MSHSDMGGDVTGSQPEGTDARARHSPAEKLLQLLSGAWTTQALYTFVELGLPELLAKRPSTSLELARDARCHEPSLRQLLRALLSIGVLQQTPDERYEFTSTGALLHPHRSDSLSSWALWWGRSLWPAWGKLTDSVRTGRSGRAVESGDTGFHLQDPQRASTFYLAATQLTRLVAPAVLETYDFGGLRSIVDVGGGHGELLAAILRAHRSLQGTLLELPYALSGARRHLEEAGVLERCQLVEGDFFASLPTDADAYILKSVLHDWDDANASSILTSCRRAMADRSRLIVIEHLLPDDGSIQPSDALADLMMLVAHGAGERTRSRLVALLHENALAVRRVERLQGGLHLLEAVPHGTL